MPLFVHRTTFVEFGSTSPADLPEAIANYVQDPDLTAVAGQPKKYWILTGDIFSLMDAGQQAAADAAEGVALTAESRGAAVSAPDIPAVEDELGIQLRELFEVFNKRDNYLVTRIEELQTALIALQGGSGNANSRLDGLPTSYLATSTRTRAQAIQDYKDDINAGGAD